MSAPTWIIEKRNGNPAILVVQGDGTYKSIAHGHGDDSLEELMTLATSANAWEDQ